MHWFKSEREAAYEMISPADRQRLEQPLDYLRDRMSDGEIPEKDSMLVAGRVDNPYDVKDIDLGGDLPEQPPGEKVAVPLELSYHDGRTGRAVMVWTDGNWHVGLPPVEVRMIEGAEDEARPGPEGDANDTSKSET